MRIAILSDCVFETPQPYGHGLGRVTSIIAEGLLKRGHDVLLFAKPGSTFSGVLVMPGDARGYEGEPALAREMLKIHKDWPFDCVLDNSHTHYLARMLPDLPVVSVFHDIYQEYRRCPVLLSEGQRVIMPPRFEDARIIPNALNPVDFEPYYEHDIEPYALLVGMSDLKQPLLAIEACARLGITLVMAGQSMIGKLPITEMSNVKYVGPVSGTRKAELFQRARVFLQLSQVESFGLTTLEASLYGTPVVGWPMGGTLNLIRYGVNGAFVCMSGKDKVQNVVDAIERAWDVPRQTCRAFGEMISQPDKQIDAYETALGDVMRGGRW